MNAYVLDSGVMIDHCDFEGRAYYGADFIRSGNSGDQNGHGTHVAGLIGSKTYGVSKKVNIIDVKVLDSVGSGTLDTVMSGLEFVSNHCNYKGKQGKQGKQGKPVWGSEDSHDDDVESKRCVINLSLGTFRSTIINEAIEELIKQGIVVVVAAGNSNMNACWTSPASVADVITVGAFDDRIDSIAKFSNWGNCVDIFAPGVLVKSLSNKFPYYPIEQTGTSMATPIVTGLVALLLDSGIKPTQIKKRLNELATDNIFPRRTLLFKPGTPNRIAFNGVKRDDDDYHHYSYPNITIEHILKELDSYTTPAITKGVLLV